MPSKDDIAALLLSEALSEDEWRERIAAAWTETEKYNAGLRARAKTREELLVLLDCGVTAVVGHTSRGSFTPRSELVIGGSSPSYGTGDQSFLEISVTSETPVKQLHFRGWPPFEKGDRIRAYIFKGKEEWEQAFMFDDQDFSGLAFGARFGKTVLVERDFQEQEKALKIEKLRNGEVVATYNQ
ncbi:MAG: hypothetical protein Q8R53_01025 [Nanoarchaeota archaeon]|nr:hypothetical protein [Nanoarchaeota archaeon]